MYEILTGKDFKKAVKEIPIKSAICKYNKGLYPSDLPRPEVELIFDNKTKLGSYNITVRKNETLIKERREMSKKSTSMYNNVLIIYLDAVSRPNFFRKLIKTSKFLEKFVRYDENANTKDFSVFQFYLSESCSDIKIIFALVKTVQHSRQNLYNGKACHYQYKR